MPPSSSDDDDSSGFRRLAHQIISKASTSGRRNAISNQIEPELTRTQILLLTGPCAKSEFNAA
jgi:hypothetical protein